MTGHVKSSRSYRRKEESSICDFSLWASDDGRGLDGLTNRVESEPSDPQSVQLTMLMPSALVFFL